uniref:Nuclear factor 7, ovary-like n=1 Tax=Hippocampus comes TaxID=109280 RepID=A0A3Q2YAA7_HIPCM
MKLLNSLQPPNGTRAMLSASILSHSIHGCVSSFPFQVHCSICLDVFTDPVSIPCGHNFCQACILGYWKSSPLYQCPMCKKSFYKRPDTSVNTVLREIAEQFKEMRLKSEVLCDVCLGGGRPKAVKSCLVCLTSFCEEHLKSHASRFTKHKLMEPVANMEDRMCPKHQRLLELFCKKDQTCVCVLCTETDHRAHYTVPVEREWTEKRVSGNETQADVVAAIEEKQRRIESQAHDLVAELEREIDELRRRGVDLENMDRTDHIHFLKVQDDVACRSCSTTTIVLPSVEDVTLDPDTANPWLQLSQDRRQVRHLGAWQDLPDHPDRFDTVVIVLGREGFTSGRHYWEVQVGEKDDWYLGVAKSSVKRKGRISVSSANGYWALAMKKGQGYRVSTVPPLSLALNPKPKTVGVYVDCEEGQISFYDVRARTHLYTFTDRLSEKILPVPNHSFPHCMLSIICGNKYK